MKDITNKGNELNRITTYTLLQNIPVDTNISIEMFSKTTRSRSMKLDADTVDDSREFPVTA